MDKENLVPILNRVIREQKDLETRLYKLNMFIADRANFNHLYDDMQFLLNNQRDIMVAYNRILEQRIKLMQDYLV